MRGHYFVVLMLLLVLMGVRVGAVGQRLVSLGFGDCRWRSSRRTTFLGHSKQAVGGLKGRHQGKQRKKNGVGTRRAGTGWQVLPIQCCLSIQFVCTTPGGRTAGLNEHVCDATRRETSPCSCARTIDLRCSLMWSTTTEARDRAGMWRGRRQQKGLFYFFFKFRFAAIFLRLLASIVLFRHSARGNTASLSEVATVSFYFYIEEPTLYAKYCMTTFRSHLVLIFTGRSMAQLLFIDLLTLHCRRQGRSQLINPVPIYHGESTSQRRGVCCPLRMFQPSLLRRQTPSAVP